MKPLYIFDLDGTCCLTHHRDHILDDRQDPDRWRRFFAACDKDSPNLPVLLTLELLRQSGADILFFSGRSDEVKDKTVAWLAHHTSFLSHDIEERLTMRPAKDFTEDHILKRQWYENMLVDDKKRLVAVYDDRQSVVDMWRSLGITCFQVAPGNF